MPTAQRRQRDRVTIVRACTLTRVGEGVDDRLVVDRRDDWFALLADEFGLTFDGVDPAALDRLWNVVRASHEAHQTAARDAGRVPQAGLRADRLDRRLPRATSSSIRWPSDVQPGDVRAMLPEHPPTEPEPFDDVLADLDRVVVPA